MFVQRKMMDKEAIKKSGATFTPPDLADFLADRLVKEIRYSSGQKCTVLDPACGEGELLHSFSKIHGRKFPEIQLSIRGFETNPAYAKGAMNVLSEFKVPIDIRVEDFLFSEGVIEEPPSLFNQVDRINYADVVIANPPYVRTQLLGSSKAGEIARRFHLKGRIDLYYPFLVSMANVLRTGGLLGVITSNRFLFTKSGETIRQFLLEKFDPVEIIDLGDTKLFNAAVLPAIFIGRKRTGSKRKGHSFNFKKIYEVHDDDGGRYQHSESVYSALEEQESGKFLVGSKRFDLKTGTMNYDSGNNGIWQLADYEERRLVDRIQKKAAFYVGDKFKVRVGIKSCADDVFIKQHWANESIVPERKLFRKLISQENIQRWSFLAKNDLEVLYPHFSLNGKRYVIDLEYFPKAKKYFELHRSKLSNRKYLIDSGRKWYEMWVPQNPELWDFPKLVFPDISTEARFYFDNAGSVVNGNCYWMVANSEYEIYLLLLVQGISNSNLMSRYHDICFNNKLYSGRRRYFSQFVEKYPVPDPDHSASKEIVDLVRKMNKLSSQDKAVDDLEIRLNKLVEASFGC